VALSFRGGAARATAAAIAAALLILAEVCLAGAALAQEAQQAPAAAPPRAAASREDFGRLFDAVVERVSRSFWNKDRLAGIGWDRRAAEARQGVVDAPNASEAVRRINLLLGEIKTSHTGLLSPDEVDYYVLLDVFSGNRDIKRQLVGDRFRAGIRFAGVGFFSVRIDGRDFIDAVLEASPADRAGLKVGDEIVAVDGAPYHPIRSFQDRIGEVAAIDIRRARGGPIETVRVDVVRVAPLKAFNEATVASARVIERGGRRIGYVHVWASYGDGSVASLKQGLAKLSISNGFARSADVEGGANEQGKGNPATPPIDALIVDMRGKIGGTGGNAGRYLDLLDPRGPRVRSLNRRDRARPWTPLRGRNAVLIDHHTRSTAELFVHAYKRERQGPLIGTRTAGAVSAASAFAMPGGNLLYLAVTGLEVDGEILEGPGVPPDIEVQRPVPYSAGADPVLEAAVDHFVRLGEQPGRAAEPPQTRPSP
jgi:carboxyl-terminal processing protease